MALLLTTADTQQLVTMREGIDVLEEGYRCLANHEATHRRRTDTLIPLGSGESYYFATMEGASRPHGLVAVRLRSDRNTVGKKKWAGRPGMFCGLVLLYDIESGELAAIINDGHLQLMRVGATSALAGRYLARPESRVLGIIGSGWQAHEHARAFAAIFPLQQIRVYSPNEAHRNAFASDMSAELGIPVSAESSARAVVEGADMVATCTDASVPVFDAAWVTPGTYVSCLRYFYEVSGPRDRVFDRHVIHTPDYHIPSYRIGKPSEWAEQPAYYRLYEGDEAPADAASLQDVVAGLAPGRTNDSQRTVFSNKGGLGIQFVTLGRVVLDRARERGVGRELPAEWFLQDITT